MEICEFSLGPSRFLKGLLLVIYGGSGILLCLTGIPLFLKLGGLALIFYGLIQKLSLHAKRSSPTAVLTLWQDAKGRWGCQARAGQCFRGVVLPDSFRSSFLVVLRLLTLNRVVTLLIPFDALPSNEYRILCTRLLFFQNKKY